MTDRLCAVMERLGGAASRPVLLRYGVNRHQIDGAVRRGELVAVFPSTYVWAWLADDIELRERAAVMRPHKGSRALSHLSALRRWELPGWQPEDDVHVTVPASVTPAAVAGVTVHRVSQMPPLVRRKGLPTVTAAEAAVTSWPLLAPEERRAPAIAATRSRLVTPAALRVAVGRAPRLAGRSALLELIDLLQAGCESELEVWGHTAVFNVAGLRHAVPQRVVHAQGRMFRLDRAYEDEMVDVEMDGRRYHESPGQRESDMERDALLASVGWQTLRFSHRRLHHDRDGCRRDTLATLAARRGWSRRR